MRIACRFQAQSRPMTHSRRDVTLGNLLRRRRIRLFLAAAFCKVVLAGCSSNTLTAGAALAKAGQTAANQMDQNVTLSAIQMSSLREAVAFNDGYNNQVGNSNSLEYLANFAVIQGGLIQYGNWLESLSASYSALGAFASYDAAGSFNSSITALATDTQKLAGAVGHPMTIPSDVTSGVSGVGGFFISYFQAREVKAASAKIEALLNQTIALLDNADTRAKLIPAQTELAGTIDQAANTLVLNGVYSFDPVLDQLGAPLGVKSTSASEAVVSKNPKIQAGLRNVLLQMAHVQADSITAAYDKSLAALKALVQQHENLQNGGAISLDNISSIIAQMQSIAASAQLSKRK